MYKFILGKKIGMTTIFKDDTAIPVTLISAGPCVVTNVITEEKNKYNAVQLGYGEKKKVNKPVLGQVHNLGKFSILREFRLPENPSNNLKIGDIIDASIFEEGEKVNITGISKGKGFLGVVGRWGFRDAPRTHGQTTKYRHPGSIGATTPQRVIKGLKMAGREGNKRVTVKNLEIIYVDKENNLIAVKGSVPGRRGSILEIRSANLTNKGKLINVK
mgnify:CR=1 FL=1